MMRLLAACLIILFALPARADEETFDYSRFGEITVYREKTEPKSIVIFFSSSKGWNDDMAIMARALMARGALVVGIDTPRYIKDAKDRKKSCLNIPGQLELLSHYIQQKYKLHDYRRPILIDYSTGAPLAYAGLAAAETGTFKGGISIGFCPKIQIDIPPCEENGANFQPDAKAGKIFIPFKKMAAPWINLQGLSEQACPVKEAASFTNNTGSSSLITLAKRKHANAAAAIMPELLEAFDRIAATPDPGIGNAIPSLADLPLVEVPAPAQPATDSFAVLITGDGGWAGIDRDVSAGLAAKGIPVIGLSSLRYFWHQKTPDGAAKDMTRIIKHYANAWHKKHVLLIGYSFGADTLPFIASRLPDSYKAMISGITLIGLSDTTKFEYQVPIGDLFGDDKDEMPVAPEVNRLRGLNLLCIYGDEEKDDPCARLPEDLIHKLILKGGHHFGGDYDPIIKAISDLAR
jgi:type IV secretory pathway VirJ component